MNTFLFEKPKNYKFLFFDMNAYFASIEQQENHYLRNKPIAVTPTICPNGCIIASSYEAKKYGVKTGMLIKDALKICPSIIFRKSDTLLYLKYHYKIIEIISNITPFYTPKSIDEIAIKISPKDQNKKKSILLAKYIKSKIYHILGDNMHCSIGIAPNIYLAKVAAEFKKPNGFNIIRYDNIKTFLAKLDLEDLCGIGNNMKNKFNSINIYRPIDIFDKSISQLNQALGKIGQYWYLNIHGFDIEFSCKKIKKPQTISNSNVLAPKLRNWDKAWPICQKLIYKAASKLRKNNMLTYKLLLYVRYNNLSSKKILIRINQTSNSFDISKYFKKLWIRLINYNLRPLKIGITLLDLTNSKKIQNELFSIQNSKKLCLSKTIDYINERYFDNNIIIPASQLYSKKYARYRITFGKPNT